MPIFLAALWGAFLNIVRSAVGSVLVSLGLSVATYTGVSTTLDWLKSQAVGALSGLPSDMVSLIAYMGVGQAISIIVSAIVVRQTMGGLLSSAGGTFKRWVKK